MENDTISLRILPVQYTRLSLSISINDAPINRYASSSSLDEQSSFLVDMLVGFERGVKTTKKLSLFNSSSAIR